MEFVLDWVKSGLVFGIFGSVILLISPNKSYMKHIGLVVGLIFMLVMIHPILNFLNLDESTYISCLKNLFLLEDYKNDIKNSHNELYQESIEIEIHIALEQSRIIADEVEMVIGDEGILKSIYIVLDEESENMQEFENYLKNLYGEEVIVQYEIR